MKTYCEPRPNGERAASFSHRFSYPDNVAGLREVRSGRRQTTLTTRLSLRTYSIAPPQGRTRSPLLCLFDAGRRRGRSRESRCTVNPFVFLCAVKSAPVVRSTEDGRGFFMQNTLIRYHGYPAAGLLSPAPGELVPTSRLPRQLLLPVRAVYLQTRL